MTEPLVLYHRGCPDGFCAAWVAKRRWPNAEFVAVAYGEDPPNAAGRDVWILDFSYKRAVLQQMALKTASLRVLDHHESALRDLEDFPGVSVEIGKSGARMTYEALFNGEKFDWLWIVDYTEDADLWRNRLPGTKEISAAIASYPRIFEAWDAMITNGYGPLINDGAVILRYKKELVSQVISGAVELVLDGHKIRVANCGVGDLESEAAGLLAENRPFGAVWSQSGGKRKWSLRSDAAGLNVARIAERYGGGGHERAAGFTESTRDPFWHAD